MCASVEIKPVMSAIMRALIKKAGVKGWVGFHPMLVGVLKSRKFSNIGLHRLDLCLGKLKPDGS